MIRDYSYSYCWESARVAEKLKKAEQRLYSNAHIKNENRNRLMCDVPQIICSMVVMIPWQWCGGATKSANENGVMNHSALSSLTRKKYKHKHYGRHTVFWSHSSQIFRFICSLWKSHNAVCQLGRIKYIIFFNENFRRIPIWSFSCSKRL